jgi:hypothetical protein
MKGPAVLFQRPTWSLYVDSWSQVFDTWRGLTTLSQADTISVAKALYDYDANAPGELSIKEDEDLNVIDREDEWLLVQSQSPNGRAGFVPANYVEEVCLRSTDVVNRLKWLVKDNRSCCCCDHCPSNCRPRLGAYVSYIT